MHTGFVQWAGLLCLNYIWTSLHCRKHGLAGWFKKDATIQREIGKAPRKLAHHRNTAVIKLSSAGKLYWANQRIDSNFPG